MAHSKWTLQGAKLTILVGGIDAAPHGLRSSFCVFPALPSLYVTMIHWLAEQEIALQVPY